LETDEGLIKGNALDPGQVPVTSTKEAHSEMVVVNVVVDVDVQAVDVSVRTKIFCLASLPSMTFSPASNALTTKIRDNMVVQLLFAQCEETPVNIGYNVLKVCLESLKKKVVRQQTQEQEVDGLINLLTVI